jgi:hypothetical protein
MERRFNTAGAVPARVPLHDPAVAAVAAGSWAGRPAGLLRGPCPRQTGKTTAIRALAQELTAGGRYAAVRFTCEHAKVAGDDYGNAQRDILQEIRDKAESALPAGLRPPPWPDASERLLGM